MYNKTILDNGLSIVTHAMPKMQSAALGIWIKAGGRYEPDEIKGISHFLEHLLFKGTKKYSCRKIKESIEGVGGLLNAFTSEELTCYLVKIPAGYLEKALDILSDMVLNPSLPEPEVEKEKQVILEEIKMYKDQPQSYVYELLDEIMWPGEPLGAPVIGTVNSVSRLVRKDLNSFKMSLYNPSNMIISAAGLLTHKKLSGLVKGIFSSPKKQAPNKFSPTIEGEPSQRL
ncbi:MAG TPA: pitrilysin family protein, partial [Candidatus Omnitrophota bacterium]|nr:pitrilysin family protein [Candidatus Omnitrophota bacterium]